MMMSFLKKGMTKAMTTAAAEDGRVIYCIPPGCIVYVVNHPPPPPLQCSVGCKYIAEGKFFKVIAIVGTLSGVVGVGAIIRAHLKDETKQIIEKVEELKTPVKEIQTKVAAMESEAKKYAEVKKEAAKKKEAEIKKEAEVKKEGTKSEQ